MEHLPAVGGFLNYRTTLQAFENVSAFVDGGWSFGGRLLYNSLVLDPDGGLRRGMTNLTVDQPEHLRRITFGDSFVTSDALGAGAAIAGVTVSREFLLDPYFVRYPSLELAGAVTTPSTVEVYLNGALVDRRELPPGRFEIDQLSLPTGRGAATLLIRDAFGGERILRQPFYASSLMLDEGLSEYRYSLGLLRENAQSESFDYSDPALLAFHRWGISDRLTTGYRLEASEDLWSGGGSIAFRSLWGEASLLAGASSDEGESGTAISAQYAYLSRRFSVGVSWTEVSDRYATLSLPAATDRTTRRIGALTTFRHGKLDLGVNASVEERRDEPEDVNRIGLTGTYPISQRGTLFASAGFADVRGDTTPELSVGVTWNLGFLRSANLRLNHDNDRTSGSVSVQQNLARDEGWGYRIDAGASDGDDTSSLLVQHQTRNALYEVSAQPSLGSDSIAVSAAGGLAWGGERLHLMRAAQQSYAVVRVPGVPGVRVYVSNLEAGRTDERGELVVTDLIPYYGNRIRIEDSDIPIHYRIAKTERIIAPPLRGGILVEFDVEPIASVHGMTRVIGADGAERVPSTGEMRLSGPEGEEVVSPLGRGGEFYFENIVPGTHSIEILDEKGACRTTIVIPLPEEPLMDLGTISCKENRS